MSFVLKMSLSSLWRELRILPDPMSALYYNVSLALGRPVLISHAPHGVEMQARARLVIWQRDMLRLDPMADDGYYIIIEVVLWLYDQCWCRWYLALLASCQNMQALVCNESPES